MAIATQRRGLAAVTGLGLAAMTAIPAMAQDVLGDLPVIGKPVDGGMGFQPASSYRLTMCIEIFESIKLLYKHRLII